FTKPEIKELCFGYNNCFTLTTRLLNRWPERERPQQEKGKENPQQTIEGNCLPIIRVLSVDTLTCNPES
ncbi:hypothetical protein T11_12715, partial [Trichinella zimbabwensis]